MRASFADLRAALADARAEWQTAFAETQASFARIDREQFRTLTASVRRFNQRTEDQITLLRLQAQHIDARTRGVEVGVEKLIGRIDAFTEDMRQRRVKAGRQEMGSGIGTAGRAGTVNAARRAPAAR